MPDTYTPPPTLYLANGDHIHDKPTRHDETGARIGDTPNRVARIEFPYLDADGREVIAAKIVASYNAHAELVEALERCANVLSDIVNAADNGQPYTAAELAGFANEAQGKAVVLLARIREGAK